jgi:hypothetical protein
MSFWTKYKPSTISHFAIIGCLSEYPEVWFKEDNEHIQDFYNYESESSIVFEALLNRVKNEFDLTVPIVRNVNEHGTISFTSAEVVLLINRYYKFITPRFGNLAMFSYNSFEQKQSSKTSYANYYNQRYSFLFGVLSRFYKNGFITFPNSCNKAEITVKLLKDIACKYVEWKSYNGEPVINKIKFEATEELKTYLYGESPTNQWT